MVTILLGRGTTQHVARWIFRQKQQSFPSHFQGTGRYPAVDPWGGAVQQELLSAQMAHGWNADRFRFCCCARGTAGWPRLYSYIVPASTSSDWIWNRYFWFFQLPRNSFVNVNIRISCWMWCSLCYTQGFFSRQYCCYYCRALAWVYADENPNLADYLYTNFGDAAPHRRTFHGFYSILHCNLCWFLDVSRKVKIIINMPYGTVKHASVTGASWISHCSWLTWGWLLSMSGWMWMVPHLYAIVRGGPRGDVWLHVGKLRWGFAKVMVINY